MLRRTDVLLSMTCYLATSRSARRTLWIASARAGLPAALKQLMHGDDGVAVCAWGEGGGHGGVHWELIAMIAAEVHIVCGAVADKSYGSDGDGGSSVSADNGEVHDADRSVY